MVIIDWAELLQVTLIYHDTETTVPEPILYFFSPKVQSSKCMHFFSCFYLNKNIGIPLYMFLLHLPLDRLRSSRNLECELIATDCSNVSVRALLNQHDPSMCFYLSNLIQPNRSISTPIYTKILMFSCDHIEYFRNFCIPLKWKSRKLKLN